MIRPRRNSLEILFNRYTEIYRQYMQDERIFDTTRAGAILTAKGISCPDLITACFPPACGMPNP